MGDDLKRIREILEDQERQEQFERLETLIENKRVAKANQKEVEEFNRITYIVLALIFLTFICILISNSTSNL